MSFNWKASGLFAAGVAFGTAGIKILSSKDAKRAYTQCTAAALRAKCRNRSDLGCAPRSRRGSP